MKVIIAGSRSFQDSSLGKLFSNTQLRQNYLKNLLRRIVADAVSDSSWKESISEIVSGHARCIDQIGEYYAKSHNIPLQTFPALWHIHTTSAGLVRNTVMANYSDALIAIYDGSSPGTTHMIQTMLKLNKPTYIVVPNLATYPDGSTTTQMDKHMITEVAPI